MSHAESLQAFTAELMQMRPSGVLRRARVMNLRRQSVYHWGKVVHERSARRIMLEVADVVSEADHDIASAFNNTVEALRLQRVAAVSNALDQEGFGALDQRLEAPRLQRASAQGDMA